MPGIYPNRSSKIIDILIGVSWLLLACFGSDPDIIKAALLVGAAILVKG